MGISITHSVIANVGSGNGIRVSGAIASSTVGRFRRVSLPPITPSALVKVSSNNLTGALYANSSISSLTISGSIIGTNSASPGFVTVTGDVGPITIGHDLRGGTVSQTGYLYVLGNIASVSIGGSIIGGLDTFQLQRDRRRPDRGCRHHRPRHPRRRRCQLRLYQFRQ